ncbi:2-oxoglutarate dehydrogenase E1 component [Kangiella sediminilitoris]|uniref:2-oxoglutarate dehydrogenase E1 component n=1 Tax=Kangiella sediminilitoris TaxID=1144748 RepID=A0A1B3BA70_9GAMM|nr:2-oxoglutarate dehydrogenase E1 component [Kangiella sediminilitoris]AOE49668.1 2-oxoglutarate dehydrogenase E1 [Kangiella sediminilitoris]
MKNGLEAMFDSAYLSGGSAAYLEELYEQYLEDPQSVDAEWREKFDAYEKVNDKKEVAHGAIREHFRQIGLNRQKLAFSQGGGDSTADPKQVKVLHLIESYRARGHHHANIDPLGLWSHPYPTNLSLDSYDLGDVDPNKKFHVGNLAGPEQQSLKEIEERLKETYCHSIGAEFLHINDLEERRWIQEKLEAAGSSHDFRDQTKKNILEGLTAAEGLEKYLGSKFPGAKRFSLEGGDSLIPMMRDFINQAGSKGTKEIVIGMAHRGRLNMLVNVMGKKPQVLFDEFAGKNAVVEEGSSGDVKYHMGYSSDVETEGGPVHLALAFNPSHLEIVSPVVIGSVRARQERRNDENCEQVLPVLIHGDSAVTGQGVVMELFNMSQARGFYVGGSVHIVINNQVGFTTSKLQDTRSTAYCTDVAKMVEAPVFHVNGDDPEAVLYVTRLALEFRNKFKKDVVIDLVCYRRHGHNEADEPNATQPVMYQKIKKHPTTRKIYEDKLTSEGTLSADEAKKFTDDYRDLLDKGDSVVLNRIPTHKNEYSVDWTPFENQSWQSPAKTAITKKQFKFLSERICDYPEDLPLQRQVKKLMGLRKEMAEGEKPMDWGFAETLAYASLLDEDYEVRICGQDSGRGTFFHRHAVLHDQDDAEVYIPLQNIKEDQPSFTVIDSVLSEEAVMAFEYGYSTNEPNSMVIWEAQFGDFANGAQVVIDQFISSGEQKWGRLSGLTLFLPHGYEGQGPEHSSARLERFLQLSAEQNMQVVVPSTPAQAFHMIRRQMVRKLRKPLIVMTPKSLLRHRDAVSNIDELTKGQFQNAIDEIDQLDKKKVERVVMCSGKVYYDLLKKRRDEKLDNVAIVRIEQLYPFPHEEVEKILASYKAAKTFVWCQEEPQNQGAWYCSRHNLDEAAPTNDPVIFAGRAASAAPAVGYASIHNEQQNKLVNDALGIE